MSKVSVDALLARLRGCPPGSDYPLDPVEREAVEHIIGVAQTVLETFERDEAQGYRSRDRQYAIALLKQVLRKGS